MSNEQHYRRLEKMYAAAPINAFFTPTLKVEEGFASIDMQVQSKFFHAAQSVHGAVYFKGLDDAAWFAAASLEPEFFVLTSSFTTYITRPVSDGMMHAVGEVVHQNRSQFIAEAVIYDEDDEQIARANGIFVRSKMKLIDTLGYLP